ncbi:hypothetical protein [Kribbella sp. NPDC051620]
MNETMKSYHVTAGQGNGELETRQRPIPDRIPVSCWSGSAPTASACAS